MEASGRVESGTKTESTNSRRSRHRIEQLTEAMVKDVIDDKANNARLILDRVLK